MTDTTDAKAVLRQHLADKPALAPRLRDAIEQVLEAVDIPDALYSVGDAVVKDGGDYYFEGWVMVVCRKRSGAIRYVVESADGLMHILNAAQLKPLTREPQGIRASLEAVEEAERVTEKAVRGERERCAQIAENRQSAGYVPDVGCFKCFVNIASAIRRGGH